MKMRVLFKPDNTPYLEVCLDLPEVYVEKGTQPLDIFVFLRSVVESEILAHKHQARLKFLGVVNGQS